MPPEELVLVALPEEELLAVLATDAVPEELAVVAALEVEPRVVPPVELLAVLEVVVADDEATPLVDAEEDAVAVELPLVFPEHAVASTSRDAAATIAPPVRMLSSSSSFA